MAAKDWERLAELVRERRVELDMTQEDARAAGGPSTATMRLIEGALQHSYQLATLRDLERVLRWERGSVTRILAGGDPVPLADPAGAPRAVPVRPPARQDVDFSGGDPEGLRPWRQQVLREAYAAVGLGSRFGPGDVPDLDEFPEAGAALVMLPDSRKPFRAVDYEAGAWDDPALTLNEKLNVIAATRWLLARMDEEERRRTGLGHHPATRAGIALISVAGKALRASS